MRLCKSILLRLLILIVHFLLKKKTEALCMEDTLYDLVIGNIDGSKLPDMSHFFLQRQLLDLRLSKAKMLIGHLRFLIRLLMKIRRL